MSRFSLFRRKPETADPDSPDPEGGKFASDGTDRKKPRKSSDADDPLLPEKKRARRRLLGAVTITLAAIIVLPMIFDSEPRTVSQDLLIDIPSRDKPSRPASGESPKKAGEKPDAVAGAGKPSATEPKKDEVRPTENVVRDSGKTGSARDKPAADGKAEAKSAAKTDTAKKQDDPIGQLIAQKGADVKANEEPGKFVIQVAAVSSQEKAKELQERLKKAGLESYTQKVALKEGGERIRIRIGPLPGRKELNSTCARLAPLKLPCTLVN